MLIPPGSGPGPHAHADIQESFFVVDGEIEFKSEAGTYTATQGSYIVIPKGGVVHYFKNKTNKTARLLCTVVPAGLEEFFSEVGQPVATNSFLPRPIMNFESLKRMQTIGEQYGQEIFPPDYLDNIDS
ncbi:MAG: cupin domain-containing protein [Candidatus Paceibacterota bacterium]